MRIFKEMKRTAIISSAIYIIVGLILAFFPDSTARTIGYAFATVILVAGLGFLYRFVTKGNEYAFVGNELAIGVILIIASVFIYLNVDSVISIIPVLLGIVIFVSGITKMQNAIGLHNMKYNGSTAVFVLAILNILFGIVLIINPFGAVTTLIMLLGIGLIFSGITDFVTTWLITKNVTRMEKDAESIEVEAKEL